MSNKFIATLILLIALTALSIWVFFDTPQVEYNTEINSSNNNNSEKVNITDLIITETKNGKKFWEVYAEYGNYKNDRNIAVLSNITGNFYEDEIVVLSVKAPTALYDSNLREFILQNGAHAANNKNIVISAEEIRWIGTEDKIVAKGNVKIIKDAELLTTSDGSSFNTNFSNLKLTGNANTYVYSNKH